MSIAPVGHGCSSAPPIALPAPTPRPAPAPVPTPVAPGGPGLDVLA